MIWCPGNPPRSCDRCSVCGSSFMISGAAFSETTGGGPPRPCPCAFAGDAPAARLSATSGVTKNLEPFMLLGLHVTGPPSPGNGARRNPSYVHCRLPTAHYLVDGDADSFAAS